MSPSEADLRAALRDGEGDGVDPDEIIWNVKAMRARRQHRLLSVAAAVVVVGGAAAGIAALAGTSSENAGSSGGSANGPAFGAASTAAGGANRSALEKANSAPAPIGPDTTSVAVSCKPQPERVALPGGGSPGQFGASGPILAEPVTSFAVCVYPVELTPGTNPAKQQQPQSLVLRDGAARQLASSLENASTTPQSVACPMIRTTRQVTIVMTPVTASGKTLKPITASTSVPACNTQVTNGTAVRYDWQIPTRLQQALGITVAGTRDVQNPTDLVPGQVVGSVGSVGAGGAASGSPVK